MTERLPKVVILAGGKGTRLSEMTQETPKPMIDVGGVPLLQHIINSYHSYGFTEFCIAGGYKIEEILSYFGARSEYDTGSHPDPDKRSLKDDPLSWYFRIPNGDKVWVYDTGPETQTGGRMLRMRNVLGPTFLMTYGDGLSDVNLSSLLELHSRQEPWATMTAVHPKPRFGAAHFGPDHVRILEFDEKKEHADGWINGGFFVLESLVLDLISGDDCNFEKDVLPILASSGNLCGYQHEGFWECIDTLRDLESVRKIYDERGSVWISGKISE